MTDERGSSRTSKVVSVSLEPADFVLLEKLRKQKRKSRSELVKDMLGKYREDERWARIYKLGRETARKFKITSEEDVLRIIDD